MTDEKKREFTLKITQANRTRIVVLTYELALTYLAEARSAEGYEDFARGIQHAKCCTDQLRSVLDYSQDLAIYLYRIYNYISLILDRALIRQDAGILVEAEQLLQKLHDAFDQIADSDTSGPAMQNTETVYSGLTYGRAGVQDNVSMGNRGFTV